MTAVHVLSHAMPKGDYGQFGAFLSVAMFIPAMPLQMVLAEQTARARALHREHELSGLIRAAWLGTFIIWLVVVGWCWCSRVQSWRSGTLATLRRCG